MFLSSSTYLLIPVLSIISCFIQFWIVYPLFFNLSIICWFIQSSLFLSAPFYPLVSVLSYIFCFYLAILSICWPYLLFTVLSIIYLSYGPLFYPVFLIPYSLFLILFAVLSIIYCMYYFLFYQLFARLSIIFCFIYYLIINPFFTILSIIWSFMQWFLFYLGIFILYWLLYPLLPLLSDVPRFYPT